MVEQFALLGVALAGLFLTGLGLTGFIAPATVSRFLLAFASSAATHFLELAIRVLVGCAFILHSPAARFPDAMLVFGWMLIGTTVVLAIVPWRWHRAFAEKKVPQALQHLRWVAAASLSFGLVVLYLAFAGPVRS